MEKVLVFLLVTIAVAYAAPDPRGLVINLEEGEICLNKIQCKSGCCQHTSAISVARCAPMVRENSECSASSLYGIYYKCPCERGLTCQGDKSIVGSITNTNYGTCIDAGRSKQ
ncbi:PREDICTED: colipase isoform X1 [Galeopterus variegatus]|uniref:Colipase n=1 Tax=Galeopterus variegatus TaxID=482537 RepID=A0ABM0SBH5_GALVR|nr:PREDICTED: colipase isoform X1 [Galeopterus variegatus]